MIRWWRRFTGKAREELLVEELSPRILYSADAAVLLQPDLLLPEAEVRSLDAYAPPVVDIEPAVAAPPPAPRSRRSRSPSRSSPKCRRPARRPPLGRSR